MAAVDYYSPPPDRPDWGWPRRRHYLKRAAAEERASLLRELGAQDVVVRESAPVEFPCGVPEGGDGGAGG